MNEVFCYESELLINERISYFFIILRNW